MISRDFRSCEAAAAATLPQNIAEGADVPIVLGYLDYKKKHAGIGPILKPTGDYQKDLAQIQNFYKNITPKYPNKGVK